MSTPTTTYGSAKAKGNIYIVQNIKQTCRARSREFLIAFSGPLCFIVPRSLPFREALISLCGYFLVYYCDCPYIYPLGVYRSSREWGCLCVYLFGGKVRLLFALMLHLSVGFATDITFVHTLRSEDIDIQHPSILPMVQCPNFNHVIRHLFK